MIKRNKIKAFLKKHTFIYQIILAFGLSLIANFIIILKNMVSIDGLISGILSISVFYTVFFTYPLVLTGYQIILLRRTFKNIKLDKSMIKYDFWTLFLAFFYEYLYLWFVKVVIFSADWTEQLNNNQIHTPIFTGSYLSIIVLLIICFGGFSILRIKSVNNLPPLLVVLCISLTYFGVIIMLVWTYQIFIYQTLIDLFLLLPVIVVILIVIKTIVLKVREFNPDNNRMSKINNIPFLNGLNKFLSNSKRWPFMGFVLMLPIFVIIIMVLILFGQAPNTLIKAFTGTSDWKLSQKISPQNISYDEHYLCTVAAGGHKKVVKPLRKGIRHNHPVIVNRQLLLANAFEQILEEKTPMMHKIVRGIYDKYGFPLARLIKSKWIADFIWIIMKPLEWLFLITIYLCDNHPEDRIAIQYTGKQIKEFIL